MSLLDEIRSTLEAAGIRHALIGALALSAYGVNRASLDLDLFVADAASLRPGLWADLQGRGVAVQIRKGDLTDPLAGVVRFQAPGETPIDGEEVWLPVLPWPMGVPSAAGGLLWMDVSPSRLTPSGAEA